jgi:hypothetical protein
MSGLGDKIYLKHENGIVYARELINTGDFIRDIKFLVVPAICGIEGYFSF